MNLNEYFINDCLLKNKYVICGACALSRNALTTLSGIHLELFTKFKELDGLNLAALTYHYNPNIDYNNFVAPMETNSNLLLPTAERALVESIKFIDFVPEDILIESLSTYLQFGGTLAALYEVADFYKVNRKSIDYWYHEMLTDEEI